MSVVTYIDRIVKRFDLNDTVVLKVPMDLGFTLTTEDFEEVSSEEMKSEYRSLIGSIGYCVITVHFDIACAVSVRDAVVHVHNWTCSVRTVFLYTFFNFYSLTPPK